MKIKFKFYVLNYDFNAHKVINFNIFQNYLLNDAVATEIKKYLRSPKNYKTSRNSEISGFDALCEEIRGLIMWQEWSRREYEISVGDAFCEDLDRYEKWDCYAQCLPNVPIIARECIYQYKEQLKNGK